MSDSQPEIPEDLKSWHEELGSRLKQGSRVTAHGTKRVMLLIERIAALTLELSRAKEAIASLQRSEAKLAQTAGENADEAAALRARIAAVESERDELLYHTRHADIADPAWHAPKTVGHLRRQLETLDPNMSIATAYFVTLSNGNLLCKTEGVGMSRERVNFETNRIETGNAEIPYGLVIWPHSSPEDREAFEQSKLIPESPAKDPAA